MYEAIIAPLTNVRAHSNADRIKLATVSGHQVIVGLNSKEGDLGVYFPCDGKLSHEHLIANSLYNKHPETLEPMGGYFGPRGRVCAQKMRGEVSDGFWQELNSLEWTEIDLFSLKSGDTFSSLNGHLICEKYYSPATKKRMSNGPNKVNKKKVSKIDYSVFKKHFDTKQIRENAQRVPEGALLYISEKLHGTSGRTGYVPVFKQPNWIQKTLGKIWPSYLMNRQAIYLSGTRNVILTKKKKDSYYQKSQFRDVIHEQIKMTGLKLGETLYYEIVGYTDTGSLIMPSHKVEDKKLKKKYGDLMTYSYGRELNGLSAPFTFYVYRITFTNDNGDSFEYSRAQIEKRCSELGFKIVPLLEGPITHTTKEDLFNKCELLSRGPSTIDPAHIREGVVVKVEHKDMEESFKYKGFWFCELENIMKNEDSFVDPEDVE